MCYNKGEVKMTKLACKTQSGGLICCLISLDSLSHISCEPSVKMTMGRGDD